MSLVLDSSATLAWLYPDEVTPAIAAVFDELILNGAFVPDQWRIEIANSLTMAMRRGRISARERKESLADLATLPIEPDSRTGEQAWAGAIDLADRHRLSVYDALYLELALRRRLPLATLDIELRKAASAEGILLRGI